MTRVPKLILAMVLVVAGFAIHAAMERPRAGEFGRLFSKQLPETPTTTRYVNVVTEAPVSERVVPQVEPLLLAPAAQEEAAAAVPIAATGVAGQRIAIVGDQSGVTIVRHAARLRGGFGRQP